MMKSNFIQSLAVLLGTIIGVGLFSLPYITSRVGFWVMLGYFLVLGAVLILIKLIYGEIVLRTKGTHRLPGYAGIYLGPSGKAVACVTNLFGFAGSLLAYLIVGGSFVFLLLGPYFGGSVKIYVLLFFAAGALLIYFGIKSIAQLELVLLIFFFLILVLIFWQGYELIDASRLFIFDRAHLFLPYGAVLFSLAGTSLIPEIREMLKDRPKDFKKVVVWAILISALTYLCFILVVVGVTGQGTSRDAIGGIKAVLGDGVVSLALFFGFLTVFTSFLTIGLTFQKTIWRDLGIDRRLAWALACFLPLALYFLGLDDFLATISVVGGVFLGVDMILLALIYLRVKARDRLPCVVVYSLILFFVLGAVYEVYYFLFG